MKHTKGKLVTKVRRYLLDFADDDERIAQEKEKSKYALQRLRAAGRARNRS